MEKHVDMNELFGQIESFPFPETAFSDLEKFAHNIHEFLPHISAQKIIRVSSKLKTETDPVSRAELEFEYQQIHDEKDTILSHTIWGGFIVSICAAYEFGIEQVFKHWTEISESSERFNSKKNGSFWASAECYSLQELSIPLYSTEQSKKILSDLKYLRNSFTHRGSLLSIMNKNLRYHIEKKSHPWLDLNVIDGRWIANEKMAEIFLSASKLELSRFSQAALNKCLEFQQIK